MAENEDRSLISLPDGSLANTTAGAKRIMSAMVEQTLAVARQEQAGIQSARRKIGEYEWREPDYRQILIWAKTLAVEPEEVIRRLLASDCRFDQEWAETSFYKGTLLKLNWCISSLPIERFDWVDGLVMTHLQIDYFKKSPTGRGWSRKGAKTLAPHLPSLTHLSCGPQFAELDLRGVPKLMELSCCENELTELDLSPVPMLTKLDCRSNPLTELDLSQLPQLTELDCTGT